MIDFLRNIFDWERWITVIFTFGYVIGLLPIILGFIGAVYFKPCSFGLC